MATEVIYARVPKHLKEQVETHAAERAMTTTTAVVDLLERGLEAVSNARSIAQLENRAAELEEELGRRSLELQGAALRVMSLEEQVRNQVAAYQGLTQRTEQVVGACPHCQGPIRGYELLVTGHCATCGKPVANLLSAAQAPGASGLDQKELLLLLGAIGVVVGIAYLQSKA